jgi:hypothetical protein
MVSVCEHMRHMPCVHGHVVTHDKRGVPMHVPLASLKQQPLISVLEKVPQGNVASVSRPRRAAARRPAGARRDVLGVAAALAARRELCVCVCVCVCV